MCDDDAAVHHHYDHQPEPEPEPLGSSRRAFLWGAFAAGGLAGVGGLARPTPARAAAGASADGLRPLSMAMHVHSSFSEHTGSMEAQLSEAARTATDVLWWTDHDLRMTADDAKPAYHFTSLNAEDIYGRPWLWRPKTAGTLTGDSGGGIAEGGSPADPVGSTSLAVRAQSASTARAAYGYSMDSKPGGWNSRKNLHGQRWTIDVLPERIGPDGYLEVLVGTSRHQARGGVSAGIYSLSYRFGGPGVPGTRKAQGRLGVVNMAAIPMEWSTVTLTPADDIALLWPDMDARDFSSNALTLSAASIGGAISGRFDYLRLSYTYASGDVPIQLQRSISDSYAPRFPSVAQRQGLEISRRPQPHINWFGGQVSMPGYEGVTDASTKAAYEAYMREQVGRIHAAGGVASYNHPYGSGVGTLLDRTTQDNRRATMAKQLLANNALDTDILEVGYVARAGVDLAHHLGLWDILSRNGRFLTGNGVTDDHNGVRWDTIMNNWVTWVWAPSNSEADLLAALRAGRAWTGNITSRASLDLIVDSMAPMGSVSVSTLNYRKVRIYATDLPAGSKVEVLRGLVDYAGTAAAWPNTSVVSSHPAADFATGSVLRTMDTRKSCFVRTQVRNSAGVLVAVSNPVWMLRSAPPGGIPPARQR